MYHVKKMFTYFSETFSHIPPLLLCIVLSALAAQCATMVINTL